MGRIGIFLLLTQFSLSAAADTLLMPYELTYSAKYNGLNISAHRTLKQLENGKYEIHTTAESFFANIAETGVFEVDENTNIINDSYQYRRNLLGKKKVEHLAYDRENNLAIYNAKDKQRKVDLSQVPGGVEPFSRLTYKLQIRRDLMNNVDDLSYPVISRGKLKTYRFENAGEELVETSLGPIRAIRVNRIRDDKERETTFWFAPELNYILVKLWQKEDDEEYQIILDQGSIDGQPLEAKAAIEETAQ